MPRLFIAIPVPESHSLNLANLSTADVDARWVPAGNHHLTLKFIGNADKARQQNIATVLEQVTRRTVYVHLRNLEVFPGLNKPRVLTVSAAHEPALMQMQLDVERHMVKLAVPSEARPYRPHVTIARFKKGRAGGVQEYLFEHRDFTMQPFLASEFSLYSSQTSPSGAIYERLSTYPLV